MNKENQPNRPITARLGTRVTNPDGKETVVYNGQGTDACMWHGTEECGQPELPNQKNTLTTQTNEQG